MRKTRPSYPRIIGRVLCGLASGYAYLILFVLALGVSNMTAGHTGQIGDAVSVSFPLLPNKIVMWETTLETLEFTKIVAIFSIFIITSAISSIVFLKIKNTYNIFFILGLEYLPIPLVGKSLRAQGMALYFMMFVIGICLICYGIALRTILKRDDYENRFYSS